LTAWVHGHSTPATTTLPGEPDGLRFGARSAKLPITAYFIVDIM
jgi:hypothetical protein